MPTSQAIPAPEHADDRISILVVEDDDVCRGVLTELLAAKGHQVLEVADGQQALELLELHAATISLIVSDINLPNLSGIDLLSHLRRNRIKIPIILITAQASIDAAVNCMKNGAFGYLSKPLDSGKLFKLVAEGIRLGKTTDSHWQAVFADEGPNGYVVERLIGEGNYGMVFLVHKSQQQFALKVIKLNGLNAKARRIANRRFLNEAKAMAALRHPNIISFHEYGLAGRDQIPYLVMEYFASDSWDHLLAQPLRVRLELLLQAARGIQAIHQAGFCHRDIKPGNLLFNCRQNILKWSDFGLIRLPESAITMSGQNVGTPAYMAPESFESHRTDSRADIFSLGVVAYEICTGFKPFRGETIHQVAAAITYKSPIEPKTLNPEIPLALQNSIGNMLNKNPAARPQTLNPVIAEWQACLDNPDWTRPPPPPTRSFFAKLMHRCKHFQKTAPATWQNPSSPTSPEMPQ
jgi:serine/threonine protein kinase/ActR/RegA family two-component response regulator